jgi:hydrogenase expression/formation protein HypC
MEFLEPPGIGPRGVDAPVDAHCTEDVIRRGDACVVAGSATGCITCSDAAVAVTVLEVRADELALVDTGAGPPEEVSIALVDAGVGDVVLVHAGEAIAVVAPVPTPPGADGSRP